MKKKAEGKRKDFIQDAIKRPGALTKAVGGKPSEHMSKVRELAKHGTSLQKHQANFYLHVLKPAAGKRKGK